MNFEKVQRRKRKAISPVLATVILIAITLIAAIAIAGFVFGLFGSFTSSAQVSASVTNLTAAIANTAAPANTPTCGAAAGSYILLSNTGTSSVSANTLTITYAGTTHLLTISGGCSVVAGSTNAILITGIAAASGAAIGEQFVGSVSMSNSAAVPFSGTFQ